MTKLVFSVKELLLVVVVLCSQRAYAISKPRTVRCETRTEGLSVLVQAKGGMIILDANRAALLKAQLKYFARLKRLRKNASPLRMRRLKKQLAAAKSQIGLVKNCGKPPRESSSSSFSSFSGSSSSAAFDGWHVLPIRSREEYQLGAIGGESEQHPHGIARSLFHPEVIYLSHDIGQVWKSVNAGASWQHTLGKGISVHAGMGIEVDPVDPARALVAMDESWNYYMPEKQGIYRTQDGGDHWDLVLPVSVESVRRYQHQVDYCLSSIDAAGPRASAIRRAASGGLNRRT